MRKSKIAKILCMAMGIVLTNGMNAEAALFTSGTHTINGDYSVNNDSVVYSIGNTILNASGDVTMTTIYPTPILIGKAVLQLGVGQITVNMNNYDLSLNSNFIGIRNNDGVLQNIKIDNVKDLNINVFGREGTQSVNAIYLHAGSVGDINVNNNMTINMSSSNINPAMSYPAILAIDNSVINIKTGGDFIVNSYDRAIESSDTGVIDIKSNGAIKIESIKGIGVATASKMYLIAAGDINISGFEGAVLMGKQVVSDTVLNITSNNGSIILSGHEYTTANNQIGNMNITAEKDIHITSTGIGNGIRAGFSDYTQVATSNFESKTGNIYIDAVDRGVYARYAGTVNLKSNTIINSGRMGLEAENGGIANVYDGLVINAPIAIQATGANSQVNAINATKRKAITGDIISNGPNTAMIDVKFGTADSHLTGKTIRSAFGFIKLDFDNGSIWNMTGDSELTDLINKSVVDMSYPGPGTYKTLKMATLNGGGTFVMNTDLQKSFDNKDVLTDSDKIVITEGSAGKHYIEIKDKSLIGGNSAEGYLLLVEDQGDKQATFEGKATSTGGVWKYMPIITDVDPDPSEFSNAPVGSRNWYLKAFEATEISENTETSISLSDTRYDNYFREDDTLLKRLGELRFVKDQPETDGIWVRYRRGGTITDRFDGTFTTMQVGYDKKTSDKRYTGLAISHTTNKHDFAEATGEGSQTALLLYNTWLGDKEHYFDIVGKVGKMRGESNFYDRNNFAYNENGDYSTWYYGASFEYGRKNRSESGWYYEPQAQLTLGRINGADYTTSLGTAVSQDAVNTILLRTGVTVGKEFNLDNPQKRSNVYGKINWLYDFKGDVGTSLRDAAGDTYSETNAYGGSSWNAGVGATVNLNRATHFYFDVEKNFGGKVRSNWMAQAGLRWAFGGPKTN